MWNLKFSLKKKDKKHLLRNTLGMRKNIAEQLDQFQSDS